jgi:hypothetical protein
MSEGIIVRDGLPRGVDVCGQWCCVFTPHDVGALRGGVRKPHLVEHVSINVV